MNATLGSILAVMAGVCLAAAGIAGCGDDEATTAPAPKSGDPLVTFTKSGGIAGVEERLVINADGDATIRDRDGVAARFTIPAPEFNALTQNLAAHPVGDFDPPPDTACADCFEYSVTYGGQSYSVDEVSLSGEAKEVIDPLLTLLSDHPAASATAGAGGK